MANGVFVNALGKVAYYATLPAAADSIVVVLLKTAQADDTLNNYDNLATLKASNSEADFTNYARKTATGLVVTPNTDGNLVDVDFDDITWANAGAAPGSNALVKLLTCYKPDTASADSAIIPLTYHDFAVTTDGSAITAQVASGGFFRATAA